MSSLSFLNRPILSFRNLTILALLASAMLLVATHSGGARSVPVASADHGVGYIFIPGPSLTWADADAFALVNFGGNLASIHSPAENSQVLSAIQGSDSWIGLNDIASPFDFEWSDGSPVDYTNFALGEPNGDGDCLYITSAGEWADSDCAVARPFVVQRPAATLTVTNLNDDGSGGTLREAIGNAQPGDIIDFAVTGTITLTSGELSINKDLTINGPGTGSLTIDGNASSRIFTIGSSATVSISGLTFKNGIGDLGGAIGINSPSTLTLSNSTVSGNEASGGDGGGIFNSGAVTLINSTVSGNSSQLGRGGGIFNSGAVNFRNTIIAGNSSSSKGPDCFGTLTSQGFNLVENVAGCTITGSEDTIIGDASLDVLADNGGPTETHALLAGSSAIDAGDPASTLTIDQRGVSRPQGPRIDIGAFELLVPTDADSDGFFSLATGGTDCNDDDINVNPGATEILNGIDDDCDGDIDAADPSLAADDLDNDGFFSLATGGTDCNDNNPNVNPNATEVLNSIDDDCDGLVDGDDPDLIPATATTITVTTTNDLGAGSLRQAINDALPGDRIDFDSSILPGTIGLTSGELSIDKDLTINGPGAGSLTIDGNASSPIFTIGSSATASISGLTIKNGTSDHDGGGIFNSGTLTLSSSTVSGNSLTFGDGGGIFNSGMLTLINSTVSGNTADSQDGGGIYNTSAGTVTLINSTVSDNTAGSDGGGIGNAFDGTVILTNSTVSGNSAGSDGGGIFNDEFSTLTLNNSTVTGNSAGLGGGIYNSVGGTVSFRNTIIAGNSASFGNGPDCFDILTSQGFNLVQDEAGCTIAGETADNITGQDPLLDVLADNGGPTLTHALRAGSPAIDAGNPATPGSEGTACESTDQRGIARPQGDACDIGAFELLVLADVNDAPVITSNGGGATAAVNAAENQTAVTTVKATDGDLPPQTLTFSITGGADQALFGIVAGTG